MTERTASIDPALVAKVGKAFAEVRTDRTSWVAPSTACMAENGYSNGAVPTSGREIVTFGPGHRRQERAPRPSTRGATRIRFVGTAWKM